MQKKFYYGWVNLAVLWLCYLLTTVPFTYTFGIVVGDMSKSLGMSMTLMTAAYTGYQLTGALLSPTIGKVIHKLDAKLVCMGGCLFMAIGCLMMAYVVKSPVLYFIVWIVLFSIGIRASSLMAAQYNLCKWFTRRRSLTFSVLLTAGGIGGFLFTPLLQKVKEVGSWQGVWLLNTACMALAFLIIALFLRNNPTEHEKAYDAPLEKPESTQAPKGKPVWATKEAVRTSYFCVLVLAFFAASYLMISVGNFAVPHFTSQQLSGEIAARAVSFFALVNTIGRLLGGSFGDRLPLKYVGIIGALVGAVGNVAVIFAASPFAAIVSLSLVGIGYGVLMVVPQNLLADGFGGENYAEINGVFNMISGIVTSMTSLVIGSMYDIFGSYLPAWIVGLSLCMLAAVMLLRLKPLVHKKNLQA